MHAHWLLKTEPSAYSIDDLARDLTTCWHGVRNYQARNFLNQMRLGDQALIYHSNAEPKAVVGLARVCREAYPDYTAWNLDSAYFDPQSTPDSPRWVMVDLEFVEKFSLPVTLAEIKSHPLLKNMVVARKGIRLSVQPVEEQHFALILQASRR